MTEFSNPLEDLRLLREAELPSGFEERLRERLVEVAGERRVVHFRARKSRPVWLLLAAIALPVAAFAAGGFLIAERFHEPNKPVALPADVKHKPALGKQTSLVSPVGTSAPVARESKSIELTEQAHSAEIVEHDTNARAHVPGRTNGVAPKVDAAKSLSPKGESIKSAPDKAEKVVPPVVERGPANIEALDLSLPKRGDSTSGAAAGRGSTKSSELRGATEKGSGNCTSTDTDAQRKNQNRESAGERRGSDSGAQSKERNQERQRKGQ